MSLCCGDPLSSDVPSDLHEHAIATELHHMAIPASQQGTLRVMATARRGLEFGV